MKLSSDRFLVVGVLLGLMFFLGPVVHAQKDEMSVQVSIDRDTIGLDEYATVQIAVSGSVQNLPSPQMPTLPQFEVYSQGRSSNISIANGVVSSTVTYRYLLLPQAAGTFPLSGIWVVHNNKRYVGNAVEITVLNQGTASPKTLEDQATNSQGETRDHFLEANVDVKNPYVNQQVTLTLKFFIALKYYGSPSLSEPTFTGFWTEVLGNKAPYYQKIGDRTYKVIERKYAVFPTQTGALTIGRAAITTTVARQRTRRQRDPFGMFFNDAFGRGEQITVRSQPVNIKVRPLPKSGRPANFTGTVGKFNINATIDRRTVELNQPVSLTIKINGVGNIKSVAEPIIPDLDNFRVYRESSNEAVSKVNDRLGGTKTFVEVFIPKRPGIHEIPALEFNFFNPQTEKYSVVRTRAAKVTVTKPEGYVASPELPFSSPELAVGSQAHDIRYIRTDIGKIVRPGQVIFNSPLYLAVNGAPVLVMVGLIALRRRRERLSSDVGYARSRRASNLARKRLSKARSLARTDTAELFYAEISRALTAFVADKLNISAHGLISDQLANLLREKGASEDMLSDLQSLLSQCDYIRFAPSSANQESIDGAIGQAEKIMTEMESVRFA